MKNEMEKQINKAFNEWIKKEKLKPAPQIKFWLLKSYLNGYMKALENIKTDTEVSG